MVGRGATVSDLLQPPNDAVMWLRRGLRAVHAGDRVQARRCFQAARDANPDEIVALLWLAWLATSREESLALLSRVLELDPTNERARAGIRWARRLPSVSEVQVVTAPGQVVGADQAERSAAAPSGVGVTQAPPAPAEEATPEEAVPGVPIRTAASKWQRFRITLEALSVAILIGLVVAVWVRQSSSRVENLATPFALTPTATHPVTSAPRVSAPPSVTPTQTPRPTATPTATRVVKRTLPITSTPVATRPARASATPPTATGTPKPGPESLMTPGATPGLYPSATLTLTQTAPVTAPQRRDLRTPTGTAIELRGVITDSIGPATPTPDIVVE